MSDQEQNNPFAIGTLAYEEWEHREALEKAFCAPPGGLRVDGEDCNLCGAYVRAQARLKHAQHHESVETRFLATAEGFRHTREAVGKIGEAVLSLYSQQQPNEPNPN